MEGNDMKRNPKEKPTGIAPRKPKMKEHSFIKNDGWNSEALGDIGLVGVLIDMTRLAYEVETCIRGSYYVEGTKPVNLLESVQEIYERLGDVVENMEGEIR